jgi:hypothetical protein
VIAAEQIKVIAFRDHLHRLRFSRRKIRLRGEDIG